MNKNRKEILKSTHSDDCECDYCWSIVRSIMRANNLDASDYHCFGREFRFSGEIHSKRFIRDDIVKFNKDRWVYVGAFNRPNGFNYVLKSLCGNITIYTDKKGLESATRVGYVDNDGKIVYRRKENEVQLHNN